MEPFHVTRHFRDPDQAAQAISGTRLEISVLGPASGPWSVTDVGNDGPRLVCGRMASPFSGCGEVARDSMLVSWSMTDDSGPWSVNGRRIEGSTLMRLEGGAEFASLTSRPLQWAALVVPHSLQEGRSPAFGAREIPHDAMVRIRGLTRTAVHLARVEETDAAKLVLANLVSHVGHWTSAGSFAGERRGAGDARRLLDLLRSQPAEPLSAGDLARVSGLDERALRREVASYFGISVARYLRLRRLNDVRRELTSVDPCAESVTQVATKHGFFDLGRFAASYRRTFGENPSATLSRTRRAFRLARIAAARACVTQFTK